MFFVVAAATAFSFAVWQTVEALQYAQRGMPNDHLVVVSSATLAIGLFIVSVASTLLATGKSRFQVSAAEDSRYSISRGASVLAVMLIGIWGSVLTFAGARQGMFLAASCALWGCAFFYERKRVEQEAFTVMRWTIRTVAVILSLPMLAGAASSIFGAFNLYNKLHLKSPIPVFPRMPANIPESDAMIFGNLCIGLPFALIGILLLREVFRGFTLFGGHTEAIPPSD